MIFKAVKLFNFGIYRGEHFIDLSACDHDKPVILFGGLNGGGKTTFLDSLQLALYGKHARCSNRGKLSYSDYLKQAVNRYAKEGAASVSLTFTHQQLTKVNEYEITRSWAINGKKDITDSVTVNVNGNFDKLLTENWDDFVSEFIPQSMSELFFFDGEKIEDLADPLRSAQLIKTGIEALLGLDLFSQLSIDLNTQRQNRQKRNLDREASKKVEELTSRKEVLESNLKALDSLIAKTITEKEELQGQQTILDFKFKNSGAHLLEALSELQAEESSVKARIGAIDSNLVKLAASALPLSLAPELFEATYKQSKLEEDQKERRSAAKYISQHNEMLLALIKEKSSDLVGTMEAVLNEMEERQKASEQDFGEIFLNSNPAVFELVSSSIEAEKEDARTLLVEKQDLIESLSIIEKKLEAIPDYASVENIIKEKESLSQSIEQKTHQLEAALEDRAQCKNQLHENESKLDATLIQKNSEEFEQKRNQQVAEHLVEMKSIVDEFKASLIKENISGLERAIKAKFDQLGRKEALVSDIKINPTTFNMTLFGLDRKPLDPKRLSAGERQLLSVAILWALAEKSKKEIPTIIDTPMGRLDGKHRTKLVENYFPHAAGQVILLSTDEEISGQYYKKLKPAIAMEYHIRYDDALRTSAIEPGYFGGQL